MTCKNCGLDQPVTEYKSYAPRGWCKSCRMERSRESQRESREREAEKKEREQWMRVSAATVKYSAEITKKLVDEQWIYWENHPGTASTKKIVENNARAWDIHHAGICIQAACVYCPQSMLQVPATYSYQYQKASDSRRAQSLRPTS